MSDHETQPESRVGTIALVGRPNAGKSTLINRLLGEKVSIVSPKPQTTRNRIVGIMTEERGQLIFLDTPGIHRPLHKLNVRMMDHVTSTMSEADVIVLIVDAASEFGGGDEFVLKFLEQSRARVPVRIAALNKIDQVKKANLLPLMQKYHQTGLFDDVIPISAATGDGIDALVKLMFESVPHGEPRYPSDIYTTQPERFLAAELIREKLLMHTQAELPYSIAVNVERWEEDADKDLVRIWASIYVERDSQKKIVIGKGGSMIRTVGTEARVELESILGIKIFLDLHVAVHQAWREDDRFLGELEWPLRGGE